MAEGRSEALAEIIDRGIRSAPRSGHQEDLSRIEGDQLVLDRLDDVLVSHPGLRVDPGEGQGGNRDDQFPLSPIARCLEIGRPAVEEGVGGRGKDPYLRFGLCAAQASCSASRFASVTSETPCHCSGEPGKINGQPFSRHRVA